MFLLTPSSSCLRDLVKGGNDILVMQSSSVGHETDILMCYKTELTKSRRKAKIKAGTEDVTQTSGCGPYWIPQQHWDSLIKKWGNDDYLKRSQTAAVNHRTKHSGSMVRHTAGSIPIAQHRVNLERHLGCPPTQIELFERAHRHDKGEGEFVDGKSQIIYEQYVSIFDQKCRDQDGNLTQHPDFDAQAWCEATAGPRKGRLYRFGHYEHPSAILHPPNARNSSQSVDQEAYRLLQSQLDEQRQQTQNLQEQFAHVLQFMASQGYQFPLQPPPSTD
ncbi:hypothetical protein AXF42_Ash006485 [Apostasia shenzhenica]|uniref:Uncharacterized protein n=1 Tax=Apostasia shenzhenica TaxID=1088818 RepID=A0A2I0AZ74_9ASPA|nr:hypothetical protein AXF42_Ash006485 [Apostasia shenzhenica]